MIAELRELGWQVDVHRARRRLSAPGRARRKAAARDKLAGVPKDCPIVIDGLALGVLPEAAANCASDIRCSRWCIIRWRWKRVWRRPMRKLARRASATRLRPRAASL